MLKQLAAPLPLDLLSAPLPFTSSYCCCYIRDCGLPLHRRYLRGRQTPLDEEQKRLDLLDLVDDVIGSPGDKRLREIDNLRQGRSARQDEVGVGAPNG
jgi:hypothetical protein